VAWPLAGALALWLGHVVWWWLRVRRGAPVDHERGMYRALAIWAVVDVALLAALHLAGCA
jgi:hypothetical protein